MVDPVLLQKSRDLPLSTKAEVEHCNAKHRPPFGFKKPRTYRDGCVLTPVYPGCSIYSRPD